MICDVGSTGVGSFCFSKFFSFTESVCLARIPVCRTPDTPLFLLLSPRPGPFSNDGVVEKRARGARRVHWIEDARKQKAVSHGADGSDGRRIRDVGMAMAG